MFTKSNHSINIPSDSHPSLSRTSFSLTTAIAKLSGHTNIPSNIKANDLLSLLAHQIKRNRRRAMPITTIHLKVIHTKNVAPITLRFIKKKINNL